MELPAPEHRTVPLTIVSSGRTHRFTVEVADTPEEQEKGLMFRKLLPADHGMVFPFEPPRPVSLWMKNMLIPIDMIFIRPDGTIATIGADAVPQSLEPVVSTEAVIAVLEIPGGRAAELGIKVGDKVEWPH
ncbi:DUF192 domain-containing protein [Sphingomonas piscis]|uniref:DUF192 domain-containing protein n=1 Tax=Sphingomonas piscis TaxID=2714943 RepID=UPI001FEB1602|nr:DUF192 domain-containing protein [Sphingomonas piscis]